MSTGKILTIVGTLIALVALVLMAIGAQTETFIVYGIVFVVGAIVAGIGKKMEDREADARYSNRP